VRVRTGHCVSREWNALVELGMMNALVELWS
jgi:hypothetical protein